MTLQVSHEANTTLTWAFGAYAADDPGIPFDVILSVDMPEADISMEAVDAAAKNLLLSAVMNGLGGRISLGWCTFMRDGRFGIGVMALQKSDAL